MDSSDATLIPILFGFTLIAALAIGIWQYLKVKKARREHHHSVSELQERERAAPDASRR